MSDIKLFRLTAGSAKLLESRASHLEKPLQLLVESNLDALLAIRFLATEHSTGSKHAGRIDTLGIDENGCPVVLEYKRSLNENVITQGLYYLDWLMDHRAEFELLVQKKLGAKAVDEIDWAEPRLICLANEFTKFDAYAIEQIERSIDLIRYRQFDGDLLLLEKINSVEADPKTARVLKPKTAALVDEDSSKPRPKWINEISETHKMILQEIERYALSLGDDVQRKNLKLYIAFTRLSNFATAVSWKSKFMLYLHLDPSKVKLEEGFTRNLHKIGHWGTGDLEITLTTLADFEKAKPLMLQAYQSS